MIQEISVQECLQRASEEDLGRLHGRVLGERFKRYLFGSALKELLGKTWGDYIEESLESALRDIAQEGLEGASEEDLGGLRGRVFGDRPTRYLLRSAFKEFLRKTLRDYVEESLGSALRDICAGGPCWRFSGRLCGRVIGERFKRYLFRSAFKELLRKTWGDYMGESLENDLRDICSGVPSRSF